MMSSSSGSVTNSINNPASALVASARPPIPLAPRLTTASTSQQSYSGANAGPSNTSSEPPFTTIYARPRQLNPRSSQSAATQALNVETSPPAARFSAYVPTRSRTKLYGSVGRGGGVEGLGKQPGLRKSNNSLAYAFENSDVPRSISRKKFDKSRTDVDSSDVNFEVLPQFRSDADFPGEVLVRCSGTDFYVHRAILYFSSPFFQAVLDGDWKETHPSLHSLSDTEDCEGSEASDENEDSKSNELLEEKLANMKIPTSPRASFYTAHFTFDHADPSIDLDPSSPLAGAKARSSILREEVEEKDLKEVQSPKEPHVEGQTSIGEEGEMTGRLKRLATPPPSNSTRELNEDDEVALTSNATQTSVPSKNLGKTGLLRKRGRDVIAIIDLSEEEASTFQDFLCLVYPNLDLLVTWYNIFPLFAFSDKFEVPHLRRACTTFLRAALAGRPIEAMALGERHGLEDVYREASRHVLENMPSWEPEELEILSSETLLKLERKRTWFLERLLKLGLANPARDYECHATCLDPQNCARLLHERWRSQYANAFKYGPPQPSIIWRHLRELESSGSAIAAPTMSACQSSSKAWVQLLFDRMYGLPTHGMTTARFLSIKLETDHGPKPRPRQVDSETTLPN